MPISTYHELIDQIIRRERLNEEEELNFFSSQSAGKATLCAKSPDKRDMKIALDGLRLKINKKDLLDTVNKKFEEMDQDR